MKTMGRGPIAVVCGLELNGLGVTRSLWKRGLDCVGVAGPRISPIHLTRSVRKVVRCQAWSEDGLLEVLCKLGSELDQKAVLFLTKDESVLWVSKRRAELEQFYLFALPPDPVVQVLIDKGRFLLLAREQGWPVPLTWDVESETELQRILPDVPFPCILKPRIRNEVYRRQSIPKAYKLFDAASVVATYRMVAQWEKEVVISEFVEGPDSQLVSCRGCWADGVPLAHFVARKLLQWPVQTGNMALAEPAPAEWCGAAVAIADKVFRHVGFSGIGAMEFKRRRDGSLAIMEPAVGRTIYSSEIAPLNGVDLPFVYYQLAAYGHDTADPRLLTGRPPNGAATKLTDSPREKLSAQTYIERGELTQAQWQELRSGPIVDMLWRPEDPGPYLAAKGLNWCSSVARMVRRRSVDQKATELSTA